MHDVVGDINQQTVHAGPDGAQVVLHPFWGGSVAYASNDGAAIAAAGIGCNANIQRVTVRIPGGVQVGWWLQATQQGDFTGPASGPISLVGD